MSKGGGLCLVDLRGDVVEKHLRSKISFLVNLSVGIIYETKTYHYNLILCHELYVDIITYVLYIFVNITIL